ncbi:DUF6082 family protein [Streptomyces sp. NPDC014006]|uniref:DUF6082 family protein n=1 Tax=Streptomyces sp. NPDC014006 TaxID=3364870 RepID=UPI0036FA97AD
MGTATAPSTTLPVEEAFPGREGLSHGIGDRSRLAALMETNFEIIQRGRGFRGARLRLLVQAFMDRQIGRRYWARFGSFREEEAAGDRTEERFTAVMRDAYVAHPDTEPVGV